MAIAKLLTFTFFLFFSTTVFADTYNEKAVYFFTQKGALACLSHAVFQEANTEPDLGKRYVIASILNRAIKNNKLICDVVREKKQFSFYRKGFNFNKTTESLTERVVLDTLGLALKGKLSSYNNVVSFHTVDVNPSWPRSREFVKVVTIGHHSFYKQRGN